MTQIFRPAANVVVRTVIVAVGFGLGGLLVIGHVAQKSTYVTGVNIPPEQEIAFNHQRHAELGLDCRFCHSSVEKTAFAGFPSTQTCMSCHKMILSEAPALAPVWESLDTGKPLRWKRVHDLPQFVYFDHSLHVKAGFDCATCHGRVDQMTRVSKQKPLYMNECLNCHRAPERFARLHNHLFEPNERAELSNKDQPLKKERALSQTPDEMDDVFRRVLDCYTDLECSASAPSRAQAFDTSWHPPADRVETDQRLFRFHPIDPDRRRLLDCYTCHR